MSELGINAKIYFGDADAALSAQTEMDNVTDVDLEMIANEADTSTRANSGWATSRATMKEATLSFDMMFESGDAGFTAIRTAYLGGTTLALTPLTGDKDVANNEGPRGNWSITTFTRTEPLQEVIKYSITAKMSEFAEWVTT